jgi:cytochrome d ubiquinol oxidase subunit II
MLVRLWYALMAVLFTGYFVLEGFDYGVGMLAPLLSREDGETRAALASIGPVWDANEVWLITAAGALFAAFPGWYASLLSAFYLPFALLLVALVLRGVSLELRSKQPSPRWRHTWDAVLVGSSAVPAVVFGMAMADLLHGLPLGPGHVLVGGLGTLVHAYSVVGGLASLSLFLLHGALYLGLRLEGAMAERARQAALILGAAATALYLLFLVLSYFYSNLAGKLGLDPGPIPIFAVLSMVSVRPLLLARRYGWAFGMLCVTIALSVMSVFLALYPVVMPSTLQPSLSLTIFAAASNPYSLRVMTVVAVGLLPFVLAYQAWTYWVFRRRISVKDSFHY